MPVTWALEMQCLSPGPLRCGTSSGRMARTWPVTSDRYWSTSAICVVESLIAPADLQPHARAGHDAGASRPHRHAVACCACAPVAGLDAVIPYRVGGLCAGHE